MRCPSVMSTVKTFKLALVRTTTAGRIMATSAPFLQQHHLRADHTHTTALQRLTDAGHIMATSAPYLQQHHLRADHTHTTPLQRLTDAWHIMATSAPSPLACRSHPHHSTATADRCWAHHDHTVAPNDRYVLCRLHQISMGAREAS
jgi:hypothetical protein